MAWMGGSRLDSGEVGAAYVWQTPGGGPASVTTSVQTRRSSTRRCSPSTRHFALLTDDRRAATGTVFVDSTAAIDRVRTGTIGPGQRFAIAPMEACAEVLSRDNDVTIRWVPAHQGITGNEKANE